MAIIYSYPKETTPLLTDLLLGTDTGNKENPTRNFTIQSIVDLITPTVPGGGTVTNIQTTGDTFISLTGGPITTTGTITATLNAGGSPSATTFLRGDNTWADAAGTDTTYLFRSSQSGVNADLLLTGTDASQTIVSLIPGNYIELTDNGFNGVIISGVNIPLGTVTSVEPGKGLALQTGVSEINPELQIDTTGSNNYIRVYENPTAITDADYIPFNQVSSGDVKTTTFNTIPITAVDLIKQYIDTGDDSDVRNNTDSFVTTGVVQQVVSLTSAEYAAVATKDVNTLYIVVNQNPSFDVTQNYLNQITGGTAGVDYVLVGPADGAIQSGIAGTPYAFNVTATPVQGKYFSTAFSASNPSGSITATATVTNTLEGVIAVVPVGTCTATAVISPNNPAVNKFSVAVTPATSSGPCPHDYTFTASATAVSGYAFTSGPFFNGSASGTITGTVTGDQNVAISVTGVVAANASPTCTTTLCVDTSGVTSSDGSQNQFTVTGDQNGDTITAVCGSQQSFSSGVSINNGYEVDPSQPFAVTNWAGSAFNGTTNPCTIITGKIRIATPANVVVTLGATDVSGFNIPAGLTPANVYSLTGNVPGVTASGASPVNYNFGSSPFTGVGVTLNSGYQYLNGTLPTITNPSGQSASSITVNTIITGTIEAVATDVTVTANMDLSGVTGSYTLNGQGASITSAGSVSWNLIRSSAASSAGYFRVDVIPSANHEYTSGPTFTFNNSPLPASGTSFASETLNITVTGTITAIPNCGTALIRCSDGDTSFYAPIGGSSGQTFQATGAGQTCFISAGPTNNCSGKTLLQGTFYNSGQGPCSPSQGGNC